MSTQVAEALDVARDLTVREGWRQGIRPKGPGRCPLVAIAQADCNLYGPDCGCFLGAADAFRAVIGEPIAEWNDAPGRRVTDVLAAFTVAAARERATA